MDKANLKTTAKVGDTTLHDKKSVTYSNVMDIHDNRTESFLFNYTKE